MSTSLPKSDQAPHLPNVCPPSCGGPVRRALGIPRLLAEIIATIAVAEAAVMFILPALELGVSQRVVGMLHATMLSLLAAPVILWRVRAMSLAQSMTPNLTAAKAQAERLADIARHTSNAVIVTDPQGRIEWVNEGFTRITGYTFDEVKGKKPGNVLKGPNTDPSASKLVGEAVRRGEGCRTEIVNYGKDGREYTLDIEIVPLRNEAGTLTGFMAIESDITEQKAAREVLRVERERLEMAASAALMGLWDWNPQTGYVRYDQRWAEMLGYRVEELRPHVTEWSDRVHPDDLPAAMEAAQQAMLHNTPYTCEHRMRHRDGSWRWILDQGRVVTRSEQGEVTRFVGSHIDITERKEFEGRLSASERRLRTIIDAEPECVKVLATDGELLEMNAAGLAMLQANSIEQVRARGIMHFVLPEHHAAFQSLHATVLGGGTASLTFEVQGLRGGRRWLDAHSVPLCDDTGSVTALLAVTRDITEQKRAQAATREAEEFLRSAIDSLDSHTVVLDSDATVLSVNRAWREFALANGGIGREVCEGANYLTVCDKAAARSPVAARVAEALRAVLTGASDPEPIEYPCHSPTERRWFLCSIRGFARGEKRFAVVSHLNITAVKTAEAELVQARLKAESASRAKSAFLANMSHEIRTPLTAILGYADALREDGDLTRAPEQRLQTIDTIRNAGQHLLTVINDILDLSKIEADKMTLESIETPVTGILREVACLMGPRAAGKGLRLDATLASPIPARIVSDPTRLRQILLNLVGNAVKFTDEGNVTIRACVAERDGDLRLLIDVEDSGSGMTPEQVGQLFQAFGQADETVTRKHGGTGLGLTICRRLAALMGGDVKLLRTEPGKGSCFRLVLPLQAVPGSAMVEKLTAVEDAGGPAPTQGTATLAGRILLAEDGPDNQRLISFHLRKAGAEVTVAENGHIALDMLEKAAAAGTPFDLLLTDMQMPEMDGYTLARTLRNRGSSLAIVALTAHAMAEDRAKCADAGCDDYATKPIDKAALLATCAEWMRKASEHKALARAA